MSQRTVNFVVNYVSGPEPIASVRVDHSSVFLSNMVDPAVPDDQQVFQSLAVGSSQTKSITVAPSLETDYWAMAVAFASDPQSYYVLCFDPADDMPNYGVSNDATTVTLTIRAETPSFGAAGETAGSASLDDGCSKPMPLVLVGTKSAKADWIIKILPTLARAVMA